jgi:hypothetical protein
MLLACTGCLIWTVVCWLKESRRILIAGSFSRKWIVWENGRDISGLRSCVYMEDESISLWSRSTCNVREVSWCLARSVFAQIHSRSGILEWTSLSWTEVNVNSLWLMTTRLTFSKAFMNATFSNHEGYQEHVPSRFRVSDHWDSWNEFEHRRLKVQTHPTRPAWYAFKIDFLQTLFWRDYDIDVCMPVAPSSHQKLCLMRVLSFSIPFSWCCDYLLAQNLIHTSNRQHVRESRVECGLFAKLDEADSESKLP